MIFRVMMLIYAIIIVADLNSQLALGNMEEILHIDKDAFHQEFTLVTHTGRRNIVKYECCPEEYVELSFVVELKRHSSYAVHLIIAPTIVLCMMVPVSFLLPTDASEKVTFGT